MMWCIRTDGGTRSTEETTVRIIPKCKEFAAQSVVLASIWSGVKIWGLNESVSKFRKNSIENGQERRWVERPTRLGRKA